MKLELYNEEEICKRTCGNRYTDGELLWYINQYYNVNRTIPEERDFSNNPKYPNYVTYIRRFGGWNDAIKKAGLWKKRYNPTHACDRCQKSFEELEKLGKFPRRECDEKGSWTGKWDCYNCYEKYDPNSDSNTRKLSADCRTGNLDPNSADAKGNLTVEIVCKGRDWEDLNFVYDNHGTPIDCRDKKTGELHQVKGRKLYISSRWKGWTFNYFENDWDKEYKSLVCICYNEDWTMVEEIYEFPSDIIKGKLNIAITKNPMNTAGTHPIIPWYEEYRINGNKREEELRKLNEILSRKLNKEKEN